MIPQNVFVKLRKDDKVNYRMQDGQWAPCKVRSIHGPDAYRQVFLSCVAFSSIFVVNAKQLDRLALPPARPEAEEHENLDLFAS